MTWAFVENGEVVSHHDALPANWQNISNFFALAENLEYLASLGWYPINRLVDVPVNDQEDVRVVRELDAETAQVLETNYVLVIDENAIAQQNQEREHQEFLNTLRDMRNKKLADCDWTVGADVCNLKGPNWLNAWSEYREKLRALPDRYVNTQDTEIENVEWPTVPSMDLSIPESGRVAFAPLDFMDRIPDPVKIKLSTRAISDPVANLIMMQFSAASQIDITIPKTQFGVGYFLSTGVITEQEAAAILSPET